jgi:GTP cyclohydrolase I
VKDAKIVQGVKLILEGLEVDTNDRNYIKTPYRVLDLLKELFGKKPQFPPVYVENYEQMVVMRGHVMWTLCPHHLLPTQFTVHIAYIPNGAVVGLSKLARIAEGCSTKPVLQEAFTNEVADKLMTGITPAPKGAGCIVEGMHLCMQMRGVKSPGRVVTSAMRGVLLTKPEARQEFLSLVGR